MQNALVKLILTIDIPASEVKAMIGDTPESRAAEKIENLIRDDPVSFLRFVTGEEVEADL